MHGYKGGRMSNDESDPSWKLDELRVKRGIWIVISGLIAVVIVFAMSMRKFSAAADVVAVLGPITSVVGSLVGAFFGLQLGSAGKEKADEARSKAEEKAARLDQKARSLGLELTQKDPAATERVTQILAN